MSQDKDALLPPEMQVKVSPAFSTSASLLEKPQLAKPRPPTHTINGFQSTAGILPPPTQVRRVGKRRYSVAVSFRGSGQHRGRANSENQVEPVLPSHFLLGGNIFDPLNLNSLLDEDVNRMTNEETPKCSPLPSWSRDPVEILVPRDITDPLNLQGAEECGEAEAVLLYPLKSRRKHRYRHHAGGGEKDKEVVPAQLCPSAAGLAVPVLTREGSVSVSPLPCELNTAITCRDDVAPPPILPRRHTHPPPGLIQKPGYEGDGRHRKRRRTTSLRLADIVTKASAPLPTKFQTPIMAGNKAIRGRGSQLGFTQPPERKDKHRYQYGNHSRYYGYHGFYGDHCEGRVGREEDPRLRLLEADWFRDKTVLDVGCGSGHITLAIARRFNPTHILGVELDKKLVHAAKQNIRHFLSHDLVTGQRRMVTGREEKESGGENKQEKVMKELQQTLLHLSFPMSFQVSRGPLSAPPLLLLPSSSSFPNNITFIQGNFVSGKEVWPGQGYYDVIICLGVTKWVQLQAGDGGVVRLFRRVYQSLSPGGILILEPHPWSSYSHSKKASEMTLQHYRTLRLRPEHFTSFLTDSVGFSSYRLLKQTGNQQPIYLFHKGSTHRK